MAIFTVDEARAFPYKGEKPLSDSDRFPDATIEAAANRITAGFSKRCCVAFVPTTVTDAIFDGPESGPLVLPEARVTAISAVGYRGYGETAWTAFTSDELAALDLDSGAGMVYRVGSRWPCGSRRIRLSYVHGYATPPDEIKYAALIVACEQVPGNNVSARATQQTNQFGTYNLAVPGWRDNQPYGIPEVDAILAEYSARGPQVG